VSAVPFDRGHRCSEAYSPARLAAMSATARFRSFAPLFPLGTSHADRSGSRGFPLSGRKTMAKFEALAFGISFVMTGILSLVALPLA
jgi:hypothetical protein